MPIKVIKIYGSLNGEIAHITNAKIDIDGYVSCTTATGDGPLNKSPQPNDGECVSATEAPYMWDGDDMSALISIDIKKSTKIPS